jgi:hypothetical protein
VLITHIVSDRSNQVGVTSATGEVKLLSYSAREIERTTSTSECTGRVPQELLTRSLKVVVMSRGEHGDVPSDNTDAILDAQHHNGHSTSSQTYQDVRRATDSIPTPRVNMPISPAYGFLMNVAFRWLPVQAL